MLNRQLKNLAGVTVRVLAFSFFVIACTATSANDAAVGVAQLSIVGGSDGISIRRANTQFTHTVVIESKNKSSVDDLKILIDPFVGPDGLRVEIDALVDGQPLQPDAAIALEGLNDIDLTLSAELIEAGTYETAIVLLYAERRETTVLSVNRTLSAPNLTITASGVTTETLPMFESATASLWINAEAQDRTIAVAEPGIRKLVQKRDNVEYASGFDEMTVDGGKDSTIDWPLTLPPASNESLRFNLAGINSPGLYEAMLVFSAADHLPTEAMVSFTVRRSGAVAGFVIALGLLLSKLLQHLKQSVQPRLQQQVDALMLRTRLRRAIMSYRDTKLEDKALIAVIDDRLRDLVAMLRLGPVADVDARLSELAAKISMTATAINLHMRLYAKASSEHAKLKNMLMDAYELIRNEDPSATAITLAKIALDNAAKAINAAPLPSSGRGIVPEDPMQEIEDSRAVASWKLRQSKLLFDTGILIISVVLGLYLLWSPNMTWGGSADLFVAFLWGLGLHTASASNPFEGLGSLAGRFDDP